MKKILGIVLFVLVGCTYAGQNRNSQLPEMRENIEIHIGKDALTIRAFSFQCLTALQKVLQRVERSFPVLVSFSESSLEYEALKVTKELKKQGFRNVELITGKSGWTLYPPVPWKEELESCKP